LIGGFARRGKAVTLNSLQGPCADGDTMSDAGEANARAWMLKQVQHDG
jgi:hypothetical protein